MQDAKGKQLRSVLLFIVVAGEMRKERIGEPVNKGRNWAAGKSFSRIISKFQIGRGAEERGGSEGSSQAKLQENQ